MSGPECTGAWGFGPFVPSPTMKNAAGAQPGQEQRMELKPCRACGKPCRVEVYGPNAAIKEPMGLWICSNTNRLGGDCPDPNGYLSADAWNARPTADLGEDGELARVEAAVDECSSDNASECLNADSFFQDAQTGRAIYARDIRALLDRIELYREVLELIAEGKGGKADCIRRFAKAAPSRSGGEAMDWQPIETAPTSEARNEAVLVYVPTAAEGVIVARFWGCWQSVEDSSDIEPTHWMPLPEPPTA